jgi:tRNA A37 threonylcarbamoyladenosine modification protein TsaB
MKLYLDTSDNQKTIVGLDSQRLEKRAGPDKSEQTLGLIDQIIKKNKKKVNDISEIEVNLGPGSYTGLKIGVAIANTFGFVLDIPVNGQRQLVLPKYEQ